MLLCPYCELNNVHRRGAAEGKKPGQRIQCKDCGGYGTVREGDDAPLKDVPSYKRSDTVVGKLARKKRFFVTSAMNNTLLDPHFWSSVKRYALRNSAQLIVIPVHYRNSSSRAEERKADAEVWWPEEVLPYLVDNTIEVHPSLWIMGNVRVAATAVNPLTGLEPLSCGASAIFGHSQIAMQCIPTPQQELAKILHTTGSLSVPSYSKSKAGKKAEFHHSLGGVIVEKQGKDFHMRVVVGDRHGAFYDMGRRYHARGVGKFERAEALITGDEHAGSHDPQVREATYDAVDSICAALRPRVIVRHDVYDGYAINHHHRGDPVIAFAKHHSRRDDVKAELELTVKYIDDTTPKDAENVVVASNHHDFLARWLREMSPKTDPRNAIIYHELMLALLHAATIDESGYQGIDPFAHWAALHIKSKTRFLDRKEPFSIKGIMLSFHGDAGPNGARGSATNMSKIGTKTVIAHLHTPAIVRGCYQVGTSTRLGLEYTRGPSSWFHTHCVVWPNGKRQLLHIVHGNWRGDWRAAA